jgi:putative colanic acid biosynthesis acetyltransferase WcaF
MQPEIQNLSEFKLPAGFRGKSVFIVQFWWIVQATIFSKSPQFLYGWRRFLLRIFGAKIGRGVMVRPSVRVTYPWKLEIGDYAWVGDHAELYTLGNITLGAHSVVSQGCYLCTGSHDYSKIKFDIYALPIIIEPEAWIASDVFVAPGVTVGRGAVVGARSSVFNDMPAYMVCVGYPAKPIRKRIRDDVFG